MPGGQGRLAAADRDGRVTEGNQQVRVVPARAPLEHGVRHGLISPDHRAGRQGNLVGTRDDRHVGKPGLRGLLAELLAVAVHLVERHPPHGKPGRGQPARLPHRELRLGGEIQVTGDPAGVVLARSFTAEGGPAPRCFCLRVGELSGRCTGLYVAVRRIGGAEAPVHVHIAGQRARRDHHAASFAQVRSRVEVQAGEYCKTVGSAYVGSNPTPATHGKDAPHLQKLWCGASLWVSGHVRL
jgi:hypothetical protein